jgi:hypothetical protein
MLLDPTVSNVAFAIFIHDDMWHKIFHLHLLVACNAGKYSVSLSISPAYSFFSKKQTKGLCGKKMD